MDGRCGNPPPACVQNAMMTKDKKPFSYTPGGIDLSEIKSPRMAKRIARNAQLESAGGHQHPKSPLAQTSPSVQPSYAAQAMGMPVQVFPTGPPPPPPQNSGAPPPPPPQPSKNHLTPVGNGADVRKSPSPQNFEPPPMGFRPEIKIPPNPMASLRKVAKPKEKNDFWIEEYRKDRSKSPAHGQDVSNQNYTEPTEYNSNQNSNQSQQQEWGRQQQQEDMRRHMQEEENKRQLQQQEEYRRRQQEEERKRLIQEEERKRYIQQKQLEEEQRRQLQQEEQRRQKFQQQEDERRRQLQQQEEERRQQMMQQNVPRSPAVQQIQNDYNRGQSPLKSPAIAQTQMYEQNRGHSPLRSPAVSQTQQYNENRGQNSLKSPAIQQIQNQYQQQIRASQSPQRSFPFQPQLSRVDSPIHTTQDNSNLQRALSPIRSNENTSTQHTQGVTNSTQQEQYNQKPNRNIGTLYVPPVETDNSKSSEQNSINQQGQRKGPPPNRWISVQPSKEPPKWAITNNNQQQQSPQVAPSIPQPQIHASHMQPGLKLQMNIDPSFNSNPRERIIPIQLEQSPTPTRTPSTPGFGPKSYNANQQQSNASSPGSGANSAGAMSPGYPARNPNQFVDQGYNNYPENSGRIRSPPIANNQQNLSEGPPGTRIIPISIEGQVQGSFDANSVRGPINQSPIVIQNDPRTLQHQNSWGSNSNGPNQSKSFRILQKITDTEDNNDAPKINSNGTQFQRPHYSRQMSSGGSIDNTTEHMKRMHVNNSSKNQQGMATKMYQPPQYIQHPAYFNEDPTQQYIHPSEQQVPEPKIYTGSAIPSRSFKILQAMTAPENAAEMENSDIDEYEQISGPPFIPYYPFPPHYSYPYPYPPPYPCPYPSLPYSYYYPSNGSLSSECDSQNFSEPFYFQPVIRRRKNLSNRNNSSQESLDSYNSQLISRRKSAPPNIVITPSIDETEEDVLIHENEAAVKNFGIRKGSLAKLQEKFENNTSSETNTLEKSNSQPQKNVDKPPYNNSKPILCRKHSFQGDLDRKQIKVSKSLTRSQSEKREFARSIRARSLPKKYENESFEKSRIIQNGSVNRSLISIDLPEIPRRIREGSLSRMSEPRETSDMSRTEREGSVLEILSQKLNDINKSQIIETNNEQLYKSNAIPTDKKTTFLHPQKINRNEYYNNESTDDELDYSSDTNQNSGENQLENVENEIKKIKSIKSVTNIQVYNNDDIEDDDPTTIDSCSVFDESDYDEGDDGDDGDDDEEIEIPNEEEFTFSEEAIEEIDSDLEEIHEDDLSIILEESESHERDLEKKKRVHKNSSNTSESSETIENQYGENKKIPLNMEEENLVTVRLPLKLSFSRSSNDENVTTVEVGNSEIEDRSQSFSIASIQDDDLYDDSDTDDCEVSVTISLPSRSSSTDFKKPIYKETPIEGINENIEDDNDVSVSFSLNMRNKFLGETLSGDITNNISEFSESYENIKNNEKLNNDENYVDINEKNFGKSTLIKNEDFWAALNETNEKKYTDFWSEINKSKKISDPYDEKTPIVENINSHENNQLENINNLVKTKYSNPSWCERKFSKEASEESSQKNFVEDCKKDLNGYLFQNGKEYCETNEEANADPEDFWAQINDSQDRKNISQNTEEYNYSDDCEIDYSNNCNNSEINASQSEKVFKDKIEIEPHSSLQTKTTNETYMSENTSIDEKKNETLTLLAKSDLIYKEKQNVQQQLLNKCDLQNLYEETTPAFQPFNSAEMSNDTLENYPLADTIDNEIELKSSVRDRIIAFETGEIINTDSNQKPPSATQISCGQSDLSRTSSLQRSESELEEDDSGVTDMNKLVSETDTESECFPELKKMTRYQRASTHSRLFKLLQDDGDIIVDNDEMEKQLEDSKLDFRPSKKKIVHNVSITRKQNPNAVKEAESMAQRRERLSLPLKMNKSIDSDNLSTSNSPISPTNTKLKKNVVSDQLVNELVQSLLLKKNSEQFKNLPMAKLQAAAKRVLEEELDSLEDTSIESTPAITPQEFKTDSYSDYYDTWNGTNNKSEITKDFEILPSKAFKNLQEQSLLGRKKLWAARCPRVLSSKTVNRDLARVTESPEMYRGSSVIRSSCEKEADNTNSYNINNFNRKL